MSPLESPMEIYEWEADETQEFTILRWEEGLHTIHPRDGRPPKDITVLRIHVPEEEKGTYPPWWDLTSARLVHQLLGMLPPGGMGPFKIRVTAIGSAPRTHFSVTRIPE